MISELLAAEIWEKLKGKIIALLAGGSVTVVAANGVTSHNQLTGVTPNQHHAAAHSINGPTHTASGSALQVLGLSATDTVGLLTPSANPGASATLLKTNSTGVLALARLNATKLQATQVVSALIPDVTEMYELGFSNKRWREGWFWDMDVSGLLKTYSLNVTRIASHLLPTLTDTQDIGSETKRWRKGYLSELSAKLFALNTTSILGGAFVVSKDAGTLPAAVTALATEIDFDKAMVPGDVVELRDALVVEYLRVLTGALNLIANPSAEVDATDYGPFSGNETVSRSTDWAQYGTASIKVVCPGATYPEGVLYKIPAAAQIAPSQDYVASVWAKGAGTIWLRYRDDEYGHYPWVGPFTLSDTPQRLSIPFTAAPTISSCPNVGLMIATHSTAQAVTFYVDGLQLEEGAVAGPYIDGDQAGYDWLGTPHASETGHLGVYKVTRDLDGSGANAWAKDAPYLVLGQDGDGRVEISALTTPRISVLRQGGAYNLTTEPVRIGDLSGWVVPALSGYGWGVGEATKHAYYTPASGLVVRGEIKADTGYLGALSIDGVLSIGAAGGIYQGTGSFASPTTGLKVWNDGGVGRLATYASGAAQVEISTDGKMLVGGGEAVLDGSGLALNADMVYDGRRAIKWKGTNYGEATRLYALDWADTLGAYWECNGVQIALIGATPAGPQNIQLNKNTSVGGTLSASGDAFLGDNTRKTVLGRFGTDNSYFANNLRFTATWDLLNTGAGGTVLTVLGGDANTAFTVRRTAAGANPRTLTPLFGVSTGGHIFDTTPSGARAYRNANQSISANTWTRIGLNTTRHDTDSVRSGEYLYARKAGYYIAGAHASTSTEGQLQDVKYTAIAIRVNGTNWRGINDVYHPVSGGSYLHVSIVTGMFWMNVNDYIEGMLYTTRDSGQTFGPGAEGSGHNSDVWLARMA